MIIPIEKIWRKFKNKYKAVHFTAHYARALKEEQSKGLADEKINPILEALKKLLSDRTKNAE